MGNYNGTGTGIENRIDRREEKERRGEERKRGNKKEEDYSVSLSCWTISSSNVRGLEGGEYLLMGWPLRSHKN